MKLSLFITTILSILNVCPTLADEVNFRREYSAFGKTPKADERPVAEKLVKVQLKDFELDAEDVRHAFLLIRNALMATDYPYGFGLIINYPEKKNYRTPIKIPKGTRTVGEAINLLCEQADLVWDFSSLKLSFTPKKVAQTNTDHPSTRPESKSKSGNKPQPTSDELSQ